VNYLEDLTEVIHKLHGGKATHIKSVPVHEVFQGKTVWDGVVEVFGIKGHPKTDKVYAWAHDTDDPLNPRRHVTVLHVPPAISPETAVRVAILEEFRNAQTA
jgi:hypothetical protein